MEFTQMNFRVSIISSENRAEITLNLATGIANILPPT
jgi:stalled ribosome rescue protein Dom34